MIPVGTYMVDNCGLYSYKIEGHIFVDDFNIRGYTCLCWDKELDCIRVMKFHEQTMMNDKKATKAQVKEFEERLGEENE